MKLTPIVVLVDDSTMSKLAPLVSELEARFTASDGEAWLATMHKNGWTANAIAWGLLLASAAQLDLELTDGP